MSEVPMAPCFRPLLTDFNLLVDQLNANGRAFRYPEDTPASPAGHLHELGQAYVERLRSLAPNAKRVTDEMPANFLFLGMIHLALPSARIIHVMRDPRDPCLSCYSKLFTADQNFSYDLAEVGALLRQVCRVDDPLA